MRDWIIVLAVAAGTTAVSFAFWLLAMPRLAIRPARPATRMAAIAVFGAALFAVPAAGFAALAERTVPVLCALFVGWGMAVRASSWFAARKFLVPRLKAMPREAGPGDAPPPPA